MSPRVYCTCDACGLESSCNRADPAPAGWYFIRVHIGTAESLLACSDECLKEMQWEKRPAGKKRRGRRS